MDRFGSVEFGILNVVAHPHPAGVYQQAFETAANIGVRYWGDRVGSISLPRESEKGFLSGRLAVWTEIDTDEPGILKDDLSEVDLEEIGFAMPDNLGLNGRIFTYVFRVEDHKLFVETKNEFGKTISIGHAARVFRNLLSAEVLGLGAPMFDITVVPEDDALERILEIPGLRRLDIHLLRPNPDDVSSQTAEVLAELEEQGAKSQDICLVKAKGVERLEPNERNKTIAQVAETNGHVEGQGKSADGETIRLSTRSYPKIVSRSLDQFIGGVQTAIRVAKETIVGPGN